MMLLLLVPSHYRKDFIQLGMENCFHDSSTPMDYFPLFILPFLRGSSADLCIAANIIKNIGFGSTDKHNGTVYRN